jgi:hypothetical protein
MIQRIAIAAAFALTATTALAEPSQGRSFTLDVVKIVGRVQKPIAAVDVGRIEPKLSLAALRPDFMGRIESAIARDPY